MVNKVIKWIKNFNRKLSDEMLLNMGINLKNKILILRTDNSNKPKEITIQCVKEVRYINNKKCIELSGRSVCNDISIIIPLKSYMKLCRCSNENIFSELNDIYIKSL